MGKRLSVFCRYAIVLTALLAFCIASGGCARGRVQNGIVYRPYADTVVEDDIEQYSAEEYEKRGDRSFMRANLEVAYFNYEKALKIEPDNQALLCKRGWLLLAGNFNKEAMRDFESVLEKNENSAVAREGLGQAYFQMHRYDEAMEQFEKAVARNAGRWRSRNFMGIMYNHRNKPLLAVQQFTAAIAVKPDSGILYNNLGMAYNQAGKYDDAVFAYQKAYELDAPREKTLNNLGVVLAKMGYHGKAEDMFKEVGDEARAYNNLGCAYLSAGDYEMAEKSFEAALGASSEPYGTASENLEKCREAMN